MNDEDTHIELSAKYQILREDYDELVDERNKLNRIITELESEVDYLEDEMQDMKYDHERELEDMQEEIDSLRDNIGEL